LKIDQNKRIKIPGIEAQKVQNVAFNIVPHGVFSIIPYEENQKQNDAFSH
jgi:hypothetical protein